MAMTNREIQAKYKERMYAEGYKQVLMWMPRDSEGKAANMGLQTFIKKLDELTAGWPKSRLSKFFNIFLQIIKANKRR